MDNDNQNINQKKNELKRITLFDKIKKKLKVLLGYREGKQFVDDTMPFIKEYSDIELANLSNIEKKLQIILNRNAKEGGLVDGLEKKDAEQLLEWVVQSDRKILDKEIGGGITNNDLMGCCGLSQGIVSTLLSNMGLIPRNSNVNPTITGQRTWRTCF